MKKWIAAILALLLSLSLFAACAGEKDEVAPEILGVKPTAAVEAGSEFDALAGVTATDDVDGDLTDSITVSSNPELEFKDGKATPDKQGDYEIIYSVKDAAGNEGNAYTTLTVTRSITQEESYKKYTFGDTDYSKVDDFGLELVTSGDGDATFTKTDGVMRVDVKNSGATRDNVRLVRSNFDYVPGTEYDVIVYLKSSVDTFFSMVGSSDEEGGWGKYGVLDNKEVTSVYREYKITFTAPSTEGINLSLYFEMGKHPLGEVSSPGSYVFDILYIKVLARTGTETLESVFKSDYTDEANTGMSLYDTATTDAIAYENGKAEVTLHTGSNRVIQETDITFDPEKNYRISFTMTSEHEQSGIICFEDKELEWEARALFENFTLKAGEETKVTANFNQNYEGTIDIPCAVFYFDTSAETATNTITVSDIELFEVKGDKVEDTTLYRFTPYSKDTEWNYFNGREETLADGMGTMYEKGGSLFYRIDEISSADYGNKFFINKINLEESALYKIKFTIKANKPGKVWFILSPYGNYDPRISQVFDFTTEAQTFECSTTQEFVLDMDFELVWSFGKGYNTEGDYLIEISDVEIIKMT